LGGEKIKGIISTGRDSPVVKGVFIKAT